MTKGKLVFTVLLLIIIFFDIINIYLYGNPFIDRPTPSQFIVAISSVIVGGIGVFSLVVFIVNNWNEPFKKK